MEHFKQYLQSKNHSPSTQEAYLRYVNEFTKWINTEPENTTKKDVLSYLEHLKKQRTQENQTRKNHLIALNHYFAFLQQNESVVINPCSFIKIRGAKKQSLYRTFAPEELQQLFDKYYLLYVQNFDVNHIPKNQRKQAILSKERNAVVLSLLLYQGTTTKEIDQIELNDLDLNRATIKIKGGKKSNDRVLSLKAEQIGLLMNYIQNVRPKLMEYQSAESEPAQSEAEGKLFLSMPDFSHKSAENQTLMHIFKALTKQVKTLDKNFLNFKQIRASVITNWIQSSGLRKAQYYAGHRYISSTENYLPNDLKSLTDDINKLHPF